MARPLTLTPDVSRRIVEAVENAMPVREACRLGGVGESTYYAWLKRAQEPDAPIEFLEFRAAIAEARACAQERLVNTVQVASLDPKNWRAAAWLLERRYPANWAETLTVRVNAEIAKGLGEFLAACRSELTPDAWEQVRGVAERMEPGAEPRGEVASEALH
jgi:transposase-like protein